MKMKSKFLYLILVSTVINPNKFISCLDKHNPAPSKAPSKYSIDAILKKNSKRDLVRENLELRQRLARQAALKPDEFKSDDVILEMGHMAGASPLSSMRQRATSDVSHISDMTDFLGAHQSQLTKQASINEELTKIAAKQVEFQDGERKYERKTRRIAVMGTVVTVAYTTAGFIWQNWGYFSRAFGQSPSE